MIFFNIQILIKVKRNVFGERFVSQYKMWSVQFSGIKIRFFPESTERLERDSESTIIKFPLSSIVSVNFVLTNLWCRGE